MHTLSVVLEIPGGGMLEQDVSVDVVDLLSGTATASGPSDDYSLATQTLTFPAGSTHGTTRSIDLPVINDTRVEGGETIDASLDNLVDGTGGQATLGVTSGATGFARVADVDGTARDADGDGVFEQLTTTDPSVTAAKLQPPGDQDRAPFEFDIMAIPVNATVLSATLKLTASSRTSGYASQVVDLLGYAGDGQLATADASGSTTVVGNVTVTSLTTHAISIDVAFVQSLLGAATHVGIASRLIAGSASTARRPCGPDVRVAHLGDPVRVIPPHGHNPGQRYRHAVF